MPRRRKPTVEEVRSLREQLEREVYMLTLEFEEISGMQVTRIDITRERKIGFGAKPEMKIDITLDL